ncbi:MAG: type II secretion system F family protein [Bacteroidales bacterium]|nr:type II secretion system F family protein [Bacteroidales bacterium]
MDVLEFIPIALLIIICIVCFGIAIVLRIHQRKSHLSTVNDSDFIDTFIDKKKRRIEANIGGMSWKMYVSLLITCPVVVGILTYFFLPYKPLCILFALIGIFIPELIIRFASKRNKNKFDEKYAAALRTMASSLRSGLSIEQSIADLGHNPFIDEKIQVGFRQIDSDIKVGVSLKDAFERFADDSGSKDAADVAAAISMQAEIGGNEAKVISTIAQTINNRLVLRKEIKTLFAETSVLVLAMDIIPWIVVLFLVFFIPDYIAPYFESTQMTIVLLIIFAVFIAGSFVIHKMIDKTKEGE